MLLHQQKESLSLGAKAPLDLASVSKSVTCQEWQIESDMLRGTCLEWRVKSDILKATFYHPSMPPFLNVLTFLAFQVKLLSCLNISCSIQKSIVTGNHPYRCQCVSGWFIEIWFIKRSFTPIVCLILFSFGVLFLWVKWNMCSMVCCEWIG